MVRLKHLYHGSGPPSVPASNQKIRGNPVTSAILQLHDVWIKGASGDYMPVYFKYHIFHLRRFTFSWCESDLFFLTCFQRSFYTTTFKCFSILSTCVIILMLYVSVCRKMRPLETTLEVHIYCPCSSVSVSTNS